MKREAGMSEDKSKKAMVDAARLADELRTEQELAQGYERERKLQECQVKDMQTRLDDAETNALKGGKKAMHKMESRIRELESEVDAEARRMADAVKNLQASERYGARVYSRGFWHTAACYTFQSLRCRYMHAALTCQP